MIPGEKGTEFEHSNLSCLYVSLAWVGCRADLTQLAGGRVLDEETNRAHPATVSAVRSSSFADSLT